MSRRKETPPRRGSAPPRPRCACAPRCACHAPLTPLPRGLWAREVAHLQTFVDWPESIDTVPLDPVALSLAVRARLLARAEQRGRRLTATARHTTRDLFWLDKELRLVLPAVHRKVAARWQRAVRWRVQSAEHALDGRRQLAAFLATYQPEPERWLRRQLTELDGGAS